MSYKQTVSHLGSTVQMECEGVRNLQRCGNSITVTMQKMATVNAFLLQAGWGVARDKQLCPECAAKFLRSKAVQR